MTIETKIEQIVRSSAKVIVDMDGWMSCIDAVSLRMRGEFMDGAKKDAHAAPLFHAVADRTEAILRGYHAALAANNTETAIGRYFDLMPADIKAKINNGAMAVLKDSGVESKSTKMILGRPFFTCAASSPCEYPMARSSA